MVRHLYVHVPFCVRRCSYCDFSIAVRKHVPGSEYAHAVLRELELLQNSPGWVNPGAQPRGPGAAGAPDAQPRGAAATGTHDAQPRGPGATGAHDAQPRGPGATEIDTLYLGGGTPSLLPPEAIHKLLNELTTQFRNPHSAIRNAIEVTIEANPEDVTAAAVQTWRSAGVNRVSLGAQSFDDAVLTWMHRSHDAARIGAAVRALRDGGIDNISLDLIFALPEQLHRDWGRDLDQAIALLPSHISLYGLTVEPRTPLDRWISRGATHLPADERYAEEYLLAHQRLTANGFQFYEVSNAARDGFRSRHNSAYWSGRSYAGLGPAAHSFDGTTRRWNLRAWEAYRRAIAEGRSPVEAEEVLTEEQRSLEEMYLGLRTAEGVPLRRLAPPSADLIVERGWAMREGDNLRCTPEGWLRLDAVVPKLFVAKELAT